MFRGKPPSGLSILLHGVISPPEATPCDNTIINGDISSEEVLDSVKWSKRGRSSGIDDLSNETSFSQCLCILTYI